MPATVARIGYITEQYRIAVSEDDAVLALHGNLARKSADPIDTFFSDIADAQAAADARQALLSSERRMFRVEARGVEEAVNLLADGLADGWVPVGRYIDTERGLDMTVLIAEVRVDFPAQTATYLVWG